MYPLVGTIGAAINVTMLTYAGVASVGISTDDAAVDDREELRAQPAPRVPRGDRGAGDRGQPADDPQGVVGQPGVSCTAWRSEAG